MDGGELFEADKIVLSTGAYTPKLLLDSAPEWEELHVGGRMVAMVVTEATVPLGEDEVEKLEGWPVAMNDNPTNRVLRSAAHRSPTSMLSSSGDK